jgi:hypothetical protein
MAKKKLSEEALKFFQTAGAKGGKKGGAAGGKQRAENLSAAELSEQGRRAAAARWAKKKQAPGKK